MFEPSTLRAKLAERAAQDLYDLRDAVPSYDTKLWLKLDKQAAELSAYGESQRPKTKSKRRVRAKRVGRG